MDANEELGSAVRITNLSITVESYGESEGAYKGTMTFEVNEDTVTTKINHEFCKVLLTNSYAQLKHVVQTHGSKLILSILNCESPISLSKQEKKAIEDAKAQSDTSSG